MTIVFEEFDNVLMQAAALANELGIDQTDVDKLIRRYRVVNGSHNGYTREVQARLMGVTPRQVDNINAEYRDDVRSRLTTRYEGVTLPALQLCCMSWARKLMDWLSLAGVISDWLMMNEALLICALAGSALRSNCNNMRMALLPLRSQPRFRKLELEKLLVGKPEAMKVACDTGNCTRALTALPSTV